MQTTINMATFPPRKKGLIRRIAELSPQCDKMRIYMNGYSEWPDDIALPDNVEYILGYGDADKGSQGKLHWVDPSVQEYYMTVDDDIIYPPDYVKQLVAGCNRYRGLAIVSFHGQRFRIGDRAPAPICKEARGARKMFPYMTFEGFDQKVHMVGNGLMCCRPDVINLTSNVTRGPKNSGDDEDMAIFAQRNRIPMIVLKHAHNWIAPDMELFRVAASFENQEYLKLQNEKLQTVRRWHLFDKPMEVRV